MWKSILALLVAAASVTAQCPHQVAVRVPENVHVGKDLGCGSIGISRDGVKVETRGCPSFILVTPAHDQTVHRPGSETFTRPSGRVDVTLLKFTCGQDWFLILPVGSSCKLVGERVVVQLTTYSQFPCDQVATASEE